jgi:hypothetical protein
MTQLLHFAIENPAIASLPLVALAVLLHIPYWRS